MNAMADPINLAEASGSLRMPDFRRARVLVVGDIMLDQYWHGATSRISPEAPVPVVAVRDDEFRLGGAGNVASNLAALGVRTELAGLCGDDAHADQLQRLLERLAITPHLARLPGARTITKLRVIAQNQQLLRLDFEDKFSAEQCALLDQQLDPLVARYDALVFSDYAKGTLGNLKRWIERARACNTPVIIDPKGVDFERYRGATVITPNFSEFLAVVGHCHDEADIAARAERLREALDLEAVLLTRSEKGMSLFQRGCQPLHLPTRALEVFDVTGAGDTVAAALAAAMACQQSLPDSARIANVAAGLVVSKLGTAAVTAPELEWALRSAESPRVCRGLCCEDELMARVARARTRGERVVMTNGCFDLLHPGHIDYLERARALGDRLIVAVNDDASVMRLKGPQRPIQPLATRMRMLSALACVDWVVSFAEDTPERIYQRVLPDVLVKGGDYAGREIAGAQGVRAAGGEVRLLEFVAGYSTTALIERILESSTYQAQGSAGISGTRIAQSAT
jgi:D-beta-D-heptose 7-phosphate kinase/D-beta-D-heptose 1-phosphate adenosyltransferase